MKVVGAHLGSMEVDVDQIAQRFDKYPNFAVDTAARVDYLMMQKPEKVRAFLIKYQDRVVYGTDNVLYPSDKTEDVLKDWAARYERDWRYFSGDAEVTFDGRDDEGPAPAEGVLRKLYHDNAVKWIPGIVQVESSQTRRMGRCWWPHVVMISAAMAVALSSATFVAAHAAEVGIPTDVPVDRLFVKKPKADITGSTRRLIVLAEPGQTINQGVADAALRWLQETAPKEGLTVDYIRTTDPIDDAYLAAHDLFVQVNYPPYRWTPVAEAAFKKAMEHGTIGWVGFHHASLLGKFDGFEMSPFFHQFMGNIVFKSYIPDFATGTVRVEDSAHPVVKGLPAAFTIENDEVVHLRPIASARRARARERR